MESRKVRLEYPLDKVSAPVLSQLASHFDVLPNVLAADINPIKGGWLLMSVTGSAPAIDSALKWVEGCGIRVIDAS